MHGHLGKNKFSSSKHETSMTEHIRMEKKKKVPPPWAYNNVPKYKVQQVPTSTDNQMKFCDDT